MQVGSPRAHETHSLEVGGLLFVTRVRRAIHPGMSLPRVHHVALKAA